MSAAARERLLSLLLGPLRQTSQTGVTSVCSAHPLVLEAACREAAQAGTAVLIEATCNQVNQEGGYTGMTPAAFRAFVMAVAARSGLAPDRVILGGDHLGPNPWRALPAEAALTRAEAMVAAYVDAGFGKIHLDCSMGCRGEPAALADAVVAARAARLARIAEAQAAAAGRKPPVYVIGTEVPPPGGATHAIETVAVTAPAAAARTLAVHRDAFAAAGVEAAFARVVALVVQPGVEFGNANVAVYARAAAEGLSRSLAALPGLVFEAHSTDYQPVAALAGLIEDGFAILKVGPGLTFALREALYGLDAIAGQMPGAGAQTLQGVMEELMVRDPRHWQGHYSGTPEQQYLQRHFSYSDRIRYYWTQAPAAAAVERLLDRLAGVTIPETLVSQYLGRLYPAVAAGHVAAEPRVLCLAAITQALAPYRSATTAPA